MPCTSAKAGQFVLRKGWYLSGRPKIATKWGLSVQQCQTWCAKYAGCRSFDLIQTRNGFCSLHKVGSSGTGIVMKKGPRATYGELCPGMDSRTYKR